jgi:hypothetical protein
MTTRKQLKFIVLKTIYENKDCTVMKCKREDNNEEFIVKRLGFPVR